jgi:hypothetical protein
MCGAEDADDLVFNMQVSNSSRDTALSHTSLESILASQKQLVLAVVGGRARGFSNPDAGQVCLH